MEPSKEQIAIVDSIINQQQNVIVNAVAGSGKTTTILLLANTLKNYNLKNHTNYHCTVLTYNKDLQQETAAKINSKGLDSVAKTYTFHGYATWLLKTVCKNNGGMRYVAGDEILRDFLDLTWTVPHIDQEFFVFDEVQDANLIHMLFFRRILQQAKHPYLVLGDERQMIWESQNARKNYLVHFDEFVKKPAVRLTLSTTFRVPSALCDVLNEALIKEPYLTPFKQNTHPALHILTYSSQLNGYHDLFKQYNPLNKQVLGVDDLNYLILQTIQNYLSLKDEHGHPLYHYDDFFILTFYNRQNTKLQALDRLLSDNNIPVFYPNNDNATIKKDQREMKNKVVISTIHGSKGRERKIVFLYGWDLNNYLAFTNDINDLKTMPNLHYVAWTRCSETLYLCIDLAHVDVQHYFPNIKINRKENFSSLFSYVNWEKLAKFSGDDVFSSFFDPNSDLLFQLKPQYQKKEFIHLRPSDNLFIDVQTLTTLKQLIDPLIIEHHDPQYTLDGIKTISVENNQTYISQIAILNAFYLLQEYLRTVKPLMFKQNLWLWKQQLIAYVLSAFNTKTNSQLRLELKERSAQYLAHNDWSKMYDEFSVAQRLRFLNTIICLTQENIHSPLLIQQYEWLNDFHDQAKVNKLFETLKIDNCSMEDELQLSNDQITYRPSAAYVFDNDDKLTKRFMHNTQSNLYNNLFSFPTTLKDLDGNKFNPLDDFKVYSESKKQALPFTAFDIRIDGRCDLANENQIIELKGTKGLDLNHFIQLILYMFWVNMYQRYLAYFKTTDPKHYQSLLDKYVKALNKVVSAQLGNKETDLAVIKSRLVPLLNTSGLQTGVLANYTTGEYYVLKNDPSKIEEIVQILLNALLRQQKVGKEDLSFLLEEFEFHWNRIKH